MRVRAIAFVGCVLLSGVALAGGPSRAVLHRVHTRAPANTAPSTAHLSYYGGPVLSHVKVQIVFWGSQTQIFGAAQLPQFYQDVTNSTYFDWLSEYNTPTQSIGRGSYLGAATALNAKIGSITDADIQTELKRLIGAGSVSAPGPDTVYMVHFPPGMSISQGGSTSCVQYCAYHGTFTNNGADVFYGVIPDQGADGCESGCGSGDHLQNTTSSTSHELIEAVTDPAVGLATTVGAPLAWYDTANGEIGDICASGANDTGLIGQWTVQKEWSNANNACITNGPPPSGSFTLSISPASQSIVAGAQATYTVNTQIASGSPGTITFSASGLPAGPTATFSPASVAAGSSATLTVQTTETTQVSTFLFTVTGRTADATSSALATLVVNPRKDLLVNGGFEHGARGWTRSGVTRITTKFFHSGAHSARVGAEGTYSGASELYQPVQVPRAGITTMRGWRLARCRSVDGGSELGALIVDATGLILSTIFKGCATDESWERFSADLTPYAGQAVYVYFYASDTGLKARAAWMFVDDVSVTNQ